MRGQRKLTIRQVKKLIRFIGYGPRCHVKVLFLGYEERVRWNEEERARWNEKEYYKNIRARMNFKPIMDLQEAHDRLGKAFWWNPFDCDGKNPVKVWNCAARFALEFANHCQWSKRKIWSAYWRNHLGRKEGSTFLMECDPIPKDTHATKIHLPEGWDNDKIWNERKNHLLKGLKGLKSQFVIAYGEKTKAKVQELFGVDKDGWQKRQKGKHQISFASKRRTHIAHVEFLGRGFPYKKGIPFIVDELVKRGMNRSRRRR